MRVGESIKYLYRTLFPSAQFDVQLLKRKGDLVTRARVRGDREPVRSIHSRGRMPRSHGPVKASGTTKETVFAAFKPRNDEGQKTDRGPSPGRKMA